ncbi:MAG: hypothetical protein IJB15_08645, partial [Clostridia bacterium]|nr:hypothetical protein [Clostridia bacterium]
MIDEQFTQAEEEQFPAISLEEICDIIEDTPRMLILTHVNPDGDCIGSAFALKLLVEAAGGSARCVCPSDLPRRLRFLMSGQDDMLFGEDEPTDE